MVATIEDPIRLRLLLERASQVFGLSEAVLSQAVALRRSGQRSDRPIAAAVSQQASGESHLERELLRALILAPHGLEQARLQVSPEDFRHPACAALAGRLWAGRNDAPEDEEAASLARELAATAMEGVEWEKVAADSVRHMIRRRLERQQREIRQRIHELHRQGQGSTPEALGLLQQSHDLAVNLSELSRGMGEWNR